MRWSGYDVADRFEDVRMVTTIIVLLVITAPISIPGAAIYGLTLLKRRLFGPTSQRWSNWWAWHPVRLVDPISNRLRRSHDWVWLTPLQRRRFEWPDAEFNGTYYREPAGEEK